MPDYSKGKIYKLVNSVDTKIYVGATCGTLRLRKNRHKCKSKLCPDRTVYKHLNIIGWENVDIILIEEIKCNNKMELSQRERYWIDELKPVLNMALPLRTQKEWRDDNKETLRDNKQKYYENNREIILERCKIYRDNVLDKVVVKNYNENYYKNNTDTIKDRVRVYAENNKEKVRDYQKEYYNNHKETLRDKNKIYRETNTEKIKDQRQLKKDNIKCPCGGSYDNGFNCKKVRHFRTAKHKKYLDTLIN